LHHDHRRLRGRGRGCDDRWRRRRDHYRRLHHDRRGRRIARADPDPTLDGADLHLAAEEVARAAGRVLGADRRGREERDAQRDDEKDSVPDAVGHEDLVLTSNGERPLSTKATPSQAECQRMLRGEARDREGFAKEHVWVA
jgi:hypothetical protein